MAQGPPIPFLGVEPVPPDRARFVVLPVPYEETTTYLKGCARGPEAILAASANVETFDEEAECEPHLLGIHTAPSFSDPSRPEELPEKLRSLVRPWAEAGAFVVTLGGEHAVTLGPVLALRDVHPDLVVLHVDAHADLRDAYDGTPYSHACIARRVQERCPVVELGIRSISAEEWRALPSLNAKVFFRKHARPLAPDRINAVLDALRGPVYLSFDIDAFDPAFAPATGTPEPGGLDWAEVSALLRELVLRRSLVAMDVTEVKPDPGDPRTEFLAARLILRTLAWIARKESGAGNA